MKLKSAIPAGILDAGLASVAMFSIGLYANRQMSLEELGVYALFVSAFLVAAVIPSQLILVPTEVDALEHETQSRLAVLQRSLRMSAMIAVASSFAVLLAVPIARNAVSDAFLWPVALTAAVAAGISPLQDHVRRVLHLAGKSWRAAVVSAVQFVVVVVGLGVGLATESYEWTIFGSLIAANAISMLVGLRLASSPYDVKVHGHWTMRILVESGKWLLIAGLVPAAAGFAASAIVSTLGSAETLGEAEAARQMGQPILVLSLGLTTVFSPRLMEAASRLDRPRALKLTRTFNGTVVGLAGLLFLFVGGQWPWNPLASFLPKSYAVPGLVLAMMAANVVVGIGSPYRAQVLGGGRSPALAGIETAASSARIGLAGLVGVAGPFAIPLSLGAMGLMRIVGWGRSLRSMYSMSAGISQVQQTPIAPWDSDLR